MSQHDMVIDNGPGLAVRQDINAAIQALVQNNSGPVEPATMYPGMFWLDTSVPPNGLVRQRNASNTGWIAPSISAEILPFVTADLSFLARTGPNRFVWNSKADGTGTDVMALDENGNFSVLGKQMMPTAQTRNRLCNPCFQISQENGNAAATSQSYVAADQWYHAHAGSGGVFTSQRVQSVTPNGSINRYRETITTADGSAAGSLYLAQWIEGTRIADFRWGTASARQVVLRFGWKSPAGTYSIRLLNGAGNRSYIANFTVAAGQANTDTEQTVVIPGDTAGTWAVDTSGGIHLAFVIAAASTAIGVTGWQAGNLAGTASNTKGTATAGAVFELFDCGLYLDPQNTGIAPPWQMPDEAAELLACQRYWQSVVGRLNCNVTNAIGYTFMVNPIVPMRIASPALTGISNGAIAFPATLSLNVYAGGFQDTRTANATQAGTFVTNIYANARM